MTWWAIEVIGWLGFVRMQERKRPSQTVRQSASSILLLFSWKFSSSQWCRETGVTKHYKYIPRILVIMVLITLVLILTFRESKLGQNPGSILQLQVSRPPQQITPCVPRLPRVSEAPVGPIANIRFKGVLIIVISTCGGHMHHRLRDSETLTTRPCPLLPRLAGAAWGRSCYPAPCLRPRERRQRCL